MSGQELWENVQEKPYCDRNRRMDFVLFFDIRDGNPNGDPDAGNLPRMDPQTRHGIVTDVCIKRKVRDYFQMALGREIYIQSHASLNSLYFNAARAIKDDTPKSGAPASEEERKQEEKKAVEALLVELDEDENDEFKKLIAMPEVASGEDDRPNDSADEETKLPFREWLETIAIDGLEFDPQCGLLSYLGEANKKQKFQDLFKGADVDYENYKSEFDKLAGLMAKVKGKGGALERKAREAVKYKMCELYDDIRLFGAVLTAGTNAGQIRGPLQLTFARSLRPILQMDAAITRCAITTSADFAKKQTEFGRKPWLDWAVYRQYGFYNPLLGEQTGVTKQDLARFWESLACMFRNSDSASKGYMEMRDVIVFVHDHKRGNAPSHVLFEQVKSDVHKENQGRKNETEDITVIKNDGFDEYYTITAPSSVGSVKVYRPLRDIWKTGL